MTALIHALRRDHRNHDRLLAVLERQINQSKSGAEPDYEVIQGIVDYFLTYPAKHHHPKEDLVFRRLEEAAPETATLIGDLEREHIACDAHLRAFAGAVSAALGSGVVFRETFNRAADAFVSAQREHMSKEERVFFPLVEKHLREEDLLDLDERLAAGSDPIFDDDGESRFDAIRQDLVKWGRETVTVSLSAGQH